MNPASENYDDIFDGLKVYSTEAEAKKATSSASSPEKKSIRSNSDDDYSDLFEGLSVTDGKRKVMPKPEEAPAEMSKPQPAQISIGGQKLPTNWKESGSSFKALGSGTLQGVKDIGHGIERFGNAIKAGHNDRNLTPELKTKQQVLMAQIHRENAQFKEMAKEHPVTASAGRIIGQSAPFLPLGFGTGALLARTGTGAAGIAARAIPQGLLGAVEGATIAGGQGGNTQNIIWNSLLGLGIGAGGQAGGEILFAKVAPVVIRKGEEIMTKVFGKAPKKPPIDASGKPTQEFEEALKAEGITVEDLTAEAVESVKTAPASARPEDVLRQAKFKAVDENFPTTRGDITQDFAHKKKEAQLRETADSGVGEDIRDIREKQSGIIENKLNKLADDLGQGRKFNEISKDALEGRYENLAERKGDLYQQMDLASNKSKPVPLFTEDIAAAIPKASTISDIADLVPAQTTAVDNLLVRYGINKAPEAIQEYLKKKGAEITPLTLNNLESFRKSLNRISRSDKDGTIDVIVGPIRKALDKEADLAAESIVKRNTQLETVEKNAPYLSQKELLEELPTDLRPKVEKAFANLDEKEGRELTQEIINYNKNPDAVKIGELSKEARSIVREMKTEFSPQSLSGKLINVKQDGVTPVIQTQQIYDHLLKPGKRAGTAHDLQQVMDNFEKAGAKGENAVKALQSKVVLELLEEGFKDVSNTSSGKQLFNSGAFNKLLKNYGEEELNIVFKNNKQALKHLKNIGEVGQLTTPSRFEALKGSGGFFVDFGKLFKDVGEGILKKMWIVKDISAVAKFAYDKTATRNALKNNPRLKESYDYIKKTYPGLFNAIEVAATNKKPKEKK